MVEKDKYDRLLKQQKTDDVPHKPEESDNRRHRLDMGEEQHGGRDGSAAESPSSSEESESEDVGQRDSVSPTDLPCRRKAKAVSFLKRLASSHPASGVDGRNFIRLKGRKVAKVPTVLQHFYGAETLPAKHARRLSKFVKPGDLRKPPSKLGRRRRRQRRRRRRRRRRGAALKRATAAQRAFRGKGKPHRPSRSKRGRAPLADASIQNS